MSKFALIAILALAFAQATPAETAVYIPMGGSVPTAVGSYEVRTSALGAPFPVQYGASGMVATPDGGQLWVISNNANQGSTPNQLGVYDARTGVQLHTETITNPPVSIAVEPSGKAVYVVTSLLGNVGILVFSTANFQQVAQVSYPFTKLPLVLDSVISQDGGRLFLSLEAYNGSGEIAAFDAKSLLEAGSIAGPAKHLAVAGKWLLRTNDYQLTTFNTTTLEQGVTAQLSKPNYALAGSPDGQTAYAAGWFTNGAALDAVDVASGALIATVSNIGPYQAIAVSPDSSEVVVGGDGTLLRFSAPTLGMLGQIRSLAPPVKLLYSPSGNAVEILYAAATETGKFDGESGALEATFVTGSAASLITGDPSGLLYVTGETGTAIFDPLTGVTKEIIPVTGTELPGASTFANGHQFIFAFYGVSVYDLSTGKVTALPPPPLPSPKHFIYVQGGSALSPDGNTLYVTGSEILNTISPPRRLFPKARG